MQPEDRDTRARRDILQAGHRIFDYIAGLEPETFESLVEKQDSVLYRLAVIGEAVSRLSGDFKDKHPGVPWRDIKDMRNFVIHDYDRVNPAIVWRAATVELPKLLKALDPEDPGYEPMTWGKG